MKKKKMMKKALCMAVIAVMLSGSSLPACAAPQQMADGALFDAEWYAARNPDVVAAYQGNTSPEALYQHYVAAGAAEGRLPYLMFAVSQNKGAQSYVRAASPVNSYLYENQAGGLTRVEHIIGHYDYTAQSNVDSRVAVEDYDSSFNLLSSRTIPMELPAWGGFYAGENYNFAIFGQENPSEDDSAEVVRVVKYSKDWQRLGHASLYGANTTIPFRAGSLRCAEYGDYLYIRTCHQMYQSSDGKNHQANMALIVSQSAMEITDAHYVVGDGGYGYASHSFNQFILVDKDRNLVTLDHGDAYPRSLVLQRNRDTKAGDSRYSGWAASSSLVDFPGEIGDNFTGASVGGFAETERGYVTAFSYDGEGGQRSGADSAIYMGYTDRNGLNSRITPITGGGMRTPVIAPIGLEGGFVMWMDKDNTVFYYTRYGTEGETAEVRTADAELSDCQPILYDGELVWYVTDREWKQTSGYDGSYVGEMTFYRLNPVTGEISKAAEW